MKLRPLLEKDASLMLEWMHDAEMTKNLQNNFASLSLSDAEKFISSSQNDDNNVHLAIANSEDEYMGTVSLKHIDRQKKEAEFAIAIRRVASSHGYSYFGMKEIIKIGLFKYNLDRIYWCVSLSNARAVKFYRKNGFKETSNISNEIVSRFPNIKDLIWFEVNKENFEEVYKNKSEVLGCRLIDIKHSGEDGSGRLSFFEEKRDFDFDIKRIYYITNAKEGSHRGFHAHKKLKQILFCPYGSILMILDDGKHRQMVELNDPSKGLIIDRLIWREMIWLKEDSTLVVGASDYYTEDDYIRNYDEFIKFVGKEK